MTSRNRFERIYRKLNPDYVVLSEVLCRQHPTTNIIPQTEVSLPDQAVQRTRISLPGLSLSRSRPQVGDGLGLEVPVSVGGALFLSAVAVGFAAFILQSQ